MMMEQQTILKSDDLQERWKSCLRSTFYTYKVSTNLVKIAEEMVNSVLEAFSNFGDHVVKTFEHIKKRIGNFAERILNVLRNLVDTNHRKSKSVCLKGHSPKNIYLCNTKVNTKGFPPKTNLQLG